MLIINADDYGRNQLATDRILACCKQSSVTSVSAMVFMADSRRAAEIALEAGIDTGLHLNFTQVFTQESLDEALLNHQVKTINFLMGTKFNFLAFNPLLSKSFEYVFLNQINEFKRLYGKAPSHFDGHHHMHLCGNVLFQGLLPKKKVVRRNFSFFPGEKSIANRIYRAMIDRKLNKSYHVTDYLFSLSQCLATDRISRVFELSQSSFVELQTHPEIEKEYKFLMDRNFIKSITGLETGCFANLAV